MDSLTKYDKNSGQLPAAGKQSNQLPSPACSQLSAESGIALVMVLILAAISLAVMAALVYMLVVSTQTSGIQKRYRTALEAGKAGAAVTYKLIDGRGFLSLSDVNLIVPALQASGTVNGVTISQSCLNWKLNYPTSQWPTACTSTLSINADPSIDPNTQNDYDMSIDIGTTAVYRVRSKIVDTVNGNSGSGLGLQKGGVVSSNSGEIQVQPMPYLYTIEVDAENKDNPQERGKYEILYQY